jgi:hypothetical protein
MKLFSIDSSTRRYQLRSSNFEKGNQCTDILFSAALPAHFDKNTTYYLFSIFLVCNFKFSIKGTQFRCFCLYCQNCENRFTFSHLSIKQPQPYRLSRKP